MKRENISSGAPWEERVGYSRAVKIGNTIEVSGTVSVEDGEVFAPDDPYHQTLKIFNIIEETLLKCGSGLKDVVRTRMFVVNINHWEEVAKAHGEVFSDIRPATSLLSIDQLISPEYLVEIEVTAIITDQ